MHRSNTKSTEGCLQNGAIILAILHTSQHQAIIVEDQLKKLAKPGAVVVHHSLSITKCLQNRIHLRER